MKGEREFVGQKPAIPFAFSEAVALSERNRVREDMSEPTTEEK